MLFYREWLTPILTIALHTEDLTRRNFGILLLCMFRFVYKTKDDNNISLVVYLKIRHIGYSIPNIFLNLFLFSLHAVISVQALRQRSPTLFFSYFFATATWFSVQTFK